MKLLFVSSLMALFISVNTYADISSIYSTKENASISYRDFLHQLPSKGHIVLGEFHNTNSIQSAQAQIIKDKSVLENNIENTRIMWEFLNHTDQEKINNHFKKLQAGLINSKQFVTLVAGNRNLSYSPIMEVASFLGHSPIALNLPRKLKKKVIDGGINSIDPKYVPAHHYVGGENYFRRFSQAMGGHVPADKLERYFLAQCLTDSVMSDQANKHHHGLSFIIAGSFHTDFYDGTVARLGGH